jgi:hypothetical protein
MRISGWRADDEPGPRCDVIRVRPLPPAEVTALRAGIRRAREGTLTGVVHTVPRGFPPAVRAVARVLVGVGTVVVLLGLVAAVVAPSAITVGVTVTAAVVVGLTGLVGFALDNGITVHGDGRLERAGWGGTRAWDLRRYARVTVASRRNPEPDDAPAE